MTIVNILLLQNLEVTAETFTARLAQENLTNKNDIPNFLKILTC